MTNNKYIKHIFEKGFGVYTSTIRFRKELNYFDVCVPSNFQLQMTPALVPSSGSSCQVFERSIHVIAQGYRGDNYYGGGEEEYGHDDTGVSRGYRGQEDYSRRRPRERRGRENDRGGFKLIKNPKQVGAALIGVGVLLTVMGMMLFFEGNLLRLGNMCIISGIPFLIGAGRVKNFFLRPERMQATIITALGIALVFMGKPRMGILCEVFGLLNLFGNMFPFLLAVGKRMPIVGDVLGAFDGSTSKKRYRPEI